MTTRPPLSLRHGLLVAAVTAAVALPTFRVAAPPKARLIPPSATTRATGLSERTNDSRVPTSLAPVRASRGEQMRGTGRPFLPPSTRPATPRITTGGSDIRVSATAYCETGTMANGQRTYDGAVAANRWALGTRLYAVELGRTFTVADRIGHGSDFDIAMPGRCGDAIRFGRRTLHVRVVS